MMLFSYMTQHEGMRRCKLRQRHIWTENITYIISHYNNSLKMCSFPVVYDLCSDRSRQDSSEVDPSELSHTLTVRSVRLSSVHCLWPRDTDYRSTAVLKVRWKFFSLSILMQLACYLQVREREYWRSAFQKERHHLCCSAPSLRHSHPVWEPSNTDFILHFTEKYLATIHHSWPFGLLLCF